MTNTRMWEQNLAEIPGFEEAVVKALGEIRTKGAKAAFAGCL